MTEAQMENRITHCLRETVRSHNNLCDGHFLNGERWENSIRYLDGIMHLARCMGYLARYEYKMPEPSDDQKDFNIHITRLLVEKPMARGRIKTILDWKEGMRDDEKQALCLD